MKIGIIGAGFTGLSAAYELLKYGHEVSLFEKSNLPGGLAFGFKEKNWSWSLEEYYHHWFTNDGSILNLAQELDYEVITKRPKTSAYVEGKIYQLDSPLHVLFFPLLSVPQRLRMGAVLAFMKVNPFWKPLERIKASEFLPRFMGEKAYEKIWEPLLLNKFGTYYKDISLAWFWSRIKKRTPDLVYPKGGFLSFASYFATRIQALGGKIHYNATVDSIDPIEGKISLGPHWGVFDKVIVTLPSFHFIRICPLLPQEYKDNLTKLHGLGAMTLILRLKKQFLTDNTYWLSICDKKSPIMAIVEHTNYMDQKHYGNEHIVYVANYIPMDSPYFQMKESEILQKFTPFLKQINKTFKDSLIGYRVCRVPFAQPIIPTNYSKQIPPFTTPIKNLFLANMQQVYPWDRGTNYAVLLGQNVIKINFNK